MKAWVSETLLSIWMQRISKGKVSFLSGLFCGFFQCLFPTLQMNLKEDLETLEEIQRWGWRRQVPGRDEETSPFPRLSRRGEGPGSGMLRTLSASKSMGGVGGLHRRDALIWNPTQEMSDGGDRNFDCYWPILILCWECFVPWNNTFSLLINVCRRSDYYRFLFWRCQLCDWILKWVSRNYPWMKCTSFPPNSHSLLAPTHTQGTLLLPPSLPFLLISLFYRKWIFGEYLFVQFHSSEIAELLMFTGLWQTVSVFIKY